MAITEGKRHQLFRRLEELLGTEEATTLMEHLPPVGWADVTTKTDLEGTRALLHADLELLRSEVDAMLERGFREQTRTLVVVNLGHTVALGSLILAAVRL
jgi:hypothetical protein